MQLFLILINILILHFVRYSQKDGCKYLNCIKQLFRFNNLNRFNFQKIALQIKANLENVTELQPDGEDFRWYLKV